MKRALTVLIKAPNGPEKKMMRQYNTLAVFSVLCAVFLFGTPLYAAEQRLMLDQLLNEALSNSPEIRASEIRVEAAGYRVPQVQTLPDPVVSFGYQNEGFSRYTYGKEQGSQWMYSVTQAFPFPGKLSIKGETAAGDVNALREAAMGVKTRVVQRIKELYFDLSLAYRTLDLIHEQSTLFRLAADAAAARYAAGRGSQQDVLAVQTEELRLLEKKEMLTQRTRTMKALLNSAVGRDAADPLARPAELEPAVYPFARGEAVAKALSMSPEVRARQRLVSVAETRVKFAEKDLLPDFSVTGSYFDRRGMFLDMWSLTASMSIPIYSSKKQKQAVNEASAILREARSELEAAKLTVSSGVEENFLMLKSAQTLMDLYRNSLIPKARQDMEAARAAYTAGKADALSVITRLNSLVELETLYWNQAAEQHKAAARLEALTGGIYESAKPAAQK